MPNYRFNRPLDGTPEGAVRSLSADEAKPLVDSKAVTETEDPVTVATATTEEHGDDKTITSSSMGGTKQAVAAPAAAKPARPSR